MYRGKAAEVAPMVTIRSGADCSTIVAADLEGYDFGAVGENDVVLSEALLDGGGGGEDDEAAGAEAEEEYWAVLG